MSSDYYFQKWKKTLAKLEEFVHLDLEYQETKAHDKKWCDAVRRLTGTLGNYMFVFNEAIDCYQHNLQVQKTTYMADIIKAVVARILELKDQLRKLVASEYQFMGHGLIDNKLTTYDIELLEIPDRHEREESIKTLVSEAILNANQRKHKSLIFDTTEPADVNENLSQKVNWWDNDSNQDKEELMKGINVQAIYALQNKEEQLSAEMLERRKMVILIQARERLRHVFLFVIRQKQKREKWEKELKGILRPPASLDMRERSARLIQRVCRAYFEAKRLRLKECKRDEILTIRLCKKLHQYNLDLDECKQRHVQQYKDYEKCWTENCEKLKQRYMERKRDCIEDDIREETFHWFRKWFDEARFFYDIPKENNGGSASIMKEETPLPSEWLEKYKAYSEQKRANKNKTAHELKFKKLEAKREKLTQKRIEKSQKRTEEAILKKMMKHPKYHPGYYYPESKKIHRIIEVINNYKTDWFSYDVLGVIGAKEKYINDVDILNSYMSVNMEIRKSVDIVMRETLNVLKKALKEDYTRNGENMPEQIKEKRKRKKKRPKMKMATFDTNVADKLQVPNPKLKYNLSDAIYQQDLALHGFLKEYTKIKLDDFIGDPNFAGDDLRCNLQRPPAFSGEARALWWERCRALAHGAHRVLLVGAAGSGKTTFVHVLASINDAVLYEVDPGSIPEELVSAVYLQDVASTIAACAAATRPSVVYIKHLHRLYYRKAPPGEDIENLNLIKIYLVQKLLKKLRKADKIVIAATCMDPWLTRSKKILKQFPDVILLPKNNYSSVSMVLQKWVLENPVIPRDLDVQSLAHVLQEYSFGHVKDTLSKFLTADRVIRIATHGLSPHEVYEQFLNSEGVPVNYNKYLTWYADKTHWGKRETKRVEEQREFQVLVEKWELKKKMKAKDSPSDVSTDIGN